MNAHRVASCVGMHLCDLSYFLLNEFSDLDVSSFLLQRFSFSDSVSITAGRRRKQKQTLKTRTCILFKTLSFLNHFC